MVAKSTIAASDRQTSTAVAAMDQYTRRFARIESSAAARDLAWLLPVRKAALAYFSDRGFPTTQDEDWRFTNVAEIAKTEFAEADADAVVSAEQIQSPRLPDGAEALIVLVNGRFAPALSNAALLPAGVRVASLASVLAEQSATLTQNLARHAAYQRNPFAALNTALFEDGAFVWVPRGTIVETPIHVLHVTTGTAQPTIAFPRTLVVAEESSQLKLIEQFVGLDGGAYFNNAVTELVAGDNAVVHHCRVLREGEQARHIATVQLHQGRDSQIFSHTTLLGGALLRHDLGPVLAGSGAHCEVHGLYVLGGAQHSDIHMRVEHLSPHCTSHEYLRGILDGRSRGIFSGRIVVYPDAQKTDAKQTNQNLLLSDDAQVTSNPQLEIHADDVKCTHGSTTGAVDDEALFYLRARGISAEAARSLLVFAFARESLAHVGIEPLRKQLAELVLARLPHGELLRDA